MNIIEKKYPESELYPYISILKYKTNPIQLLGTGGNASQLYPSDIDFFTKISTNETPQSAFKTFSTMIKKFDKRKDMFFIEFKIQDKFGEKGKFTDLNKITETEFNKYFNDDIDYCKFDFVLFLDRQFIELSIIYVFNKDALDYDKLKISLSNDFMDLVKEKKYYKSLKRLFALLKLEHPIKFEELKKISQLFNSEVGKLYKSNSELKAIKLLLEHYKDDNTKKLAMYSFNNLGFSNLK